MAEDFHAILGVPHDASQVAIRHAFLELAKQCHPDLHPDDPSAAEKFKQIHTAFRKIYRPRWRPSRAVFTSESLLEEIARRANAKERPRDFLVAVLVVFLIGLLALAGTTLIKVPEREDAIRPAVVKNDVISDSIEARIAKFRKAGWRIQLEKRIPGWPVISADSYSSNTTDADLKFIEGLTQLQRLHVVGKDVTDAGLEHLRGLTQLRELTLSNARVTDAGLEHLRGLTQLRWLTLSNVRVTDAGLKHLTGLKELGWLSLTNVRVTDVGVMSLCKALPGLKVSR